MNMRVVFGMLALSSAVVCMAAETEPTASDETALAKKLANPVADLISIPLQYNYDHDIGPADQGNRLLINIQPVIPVSLGKNWNLITRTILPISAQVDIPNNGDRKSGLGDTLASQFLSPKTPTESGWILGAGPAELIPTATDHSLGGQKWGAGPTAVALKQRGPWTYGTLANHIWSVAGNDNRSDISATFIQPFLTYITPTKTTLALNTETTYDWEANDWAIPLNFNILQLLKFDSQIIQAGIGARYWAASSANGPEGWGFRATFTFLLPK